MAAATTTKSGTSIEIKAIDDVDWDYGVSGNANDVKPRLQSITFYGHVANDIICIKDGSATGPIIMQHLIPTAKTSHTVYFDGARKRPYIDVSACTTNAASLVLISLWTGGRGR